MVLHRLSLVASSVGLLFIGVHRLLTATAPFVVEHGLWRAGSVTVTQEFNCSTARGILLDQVLNLCSLQWQADS